VLIFQKIARKVGTSGWVRGTNTRLFCKTNFFFQATKSPPPNLLLFRGKNSKKFSKMVRF